MRGSKIATCCYCGTRAALVLNGRDRHELACSNCGAPLHDLKMLKVDHPIDHHTVKPSPVRDYRKPKKDKRKRYKKSYRKKSMKSRFFEEAFDLIEDIFD